MLNWQSFSIGASNSVSIQQPGAASQVLNRVTGQDPSAVLGSLQSNGRVWLLNPNGVLFGKDARIDVGGLVASTLSMDTADFLAGRWRLRADGSQLQGASVVNQGAIRSSYGGSVYLVGADVRNSGSIDAPGGQAALLGATEVDLIDSGTPYVTLRVPTGAGLVQQDGSIRAGRIDLHGAVVNQTGLLDANTLQTDATGKIVLRATQSINTAAGSRTQAAGGSVVVASDGDATLGGVVDVSSVAGIGGRIEANATQRLTVANGARLLADGSTGGGSISLGGDALHGDSLVRRLIVEKDVEVSASATVLGDGGKIVLWSQDMTAVLGSLNATGGATGGNGGFIETSGLAGLAVDRAADASAAKGRAGMWLMDPQNITIAASGSNSNVSGAPNYTSTGNSAVINASNISAALSAGTNVNVTTASAGSQAGDISVTGVISATTPVGSTGTRLTLNASNNIFITAPIFALSAGGTLDLALNSNLAGAGGTTSITSSIGLRGGTLTLGNSAILGNPGAGTISNATVAGSGSTRLTLNNATLSDVVANVGLDLTTGYLQQGPNTILRANAGMTWTGGNLVSGTGATLLVPSGQTMRIGGTSGALMTGGTLRNEGTISMEFSQVLNLSFGTTLYNAGLLRFINSTGSFIYSTGTLVNTGTVDNASAGPVTIDSSNVFDNIGATFQRSGTGSLLINNGNFYGATRNIGTPFLMNADFKDGSTVDGRLILMGSNRFGNVTLNGLAQSDVSVLMATGKTLTLNGGFFLGGTKGTASLTGDGVVIVPVGQTLYTFNSGLQAIQLTTLDNRGTLLVNSNLDISGATAVRNSGTIQLNQGNVSFLGTSTLQNVGGVVESIGAGSSNLQVNGSILADATVRQSGTGLFTLSNGNYAGNLTFVGNNIRAIGTSSFADGSVLNGPLTLANNVTSGNVTVNGLLTSSSNMTLGAGKTLTLNGGFSFLAGSVTDAGTLLLGAGQTTRINTNTFFDVGTIDNRGTLAVQAVPGSSAIVLSVGGAIRRSTTAVR